ncbi:DUF418 domain-containing protein [Nocardia sp. CA-135953]|uniref:DUF418 domain-containing protein n=1 Tax=Nocardia sp. CA-135953 TaxID=3239978 RepID=UPI003D95D9F4
MWRYDGRTPTADSKVTGVRAVDRIAEIDALRGFALFGILLANIVFFASGYPAHLAADPAYASRLDSAATWLIAFLIDTKFYLLFSFLFGYSFTLQIDSAARADARFTPRFLRRLGGLFVLGILHAVLLFHGDILTTYALLGLILLTFRKVSTTVALASALMLTVAVAVTVLLAGNPVAVDSTAALIEGARTTDAFRGGPGSVIAEHLRLVPAQLASNAGQAPLALSAFLVGLAAGRGRVLSDLDRYAHLLRRIQWIGYPVGLAGALVFASGGGTRNTGTLAVGLLTAPLLAAAYGASALLLLRSRMGSRPVRGLAAAGRMALSNYVGQSVICVLVFTGCGFGLVGRIAPSLVILVAFAIFGCQLAMSAWWMGRHRYGPLEWVLRVITYARRPSP